MRKTIVKENSLNLDAKFFSTNKNFKKKFKPERNSGKLNILKSKPPLEILSNESVISKKKNQGNDDVEKVGRNDLESVCDKAIKTKKKSKDKIILNQSKNKNSSEIQNQNDKSMDDLGHVKETSTSNKRKKETASLDEGHSSLPLGKKEHIPLSEMKQSGDGGANKHSIKTDGVEVQPKRKKNKNKFKQKADATQSQDLMEEYGSQPSKGFKSKGKKKTINIEKNLPEDGSNSELDWDSYPSDTDDESRSPISKLRTNFADVSSDDSSSSMSDTDSVHTFDADSYPSDTEDEDEPKKGLPKNSIPSAELEEREKRTIFVGNLPYSVERNELKKWFFKFGKVECVRLRSAPIADPELPRKVCVIKKTFHESRSNIHAYIRFKTVEAAQNALQANGALFKEHFIRVDSSIPEGKHDPSKAVFIGNLPFALEEDALRNFFSDCGEIDSVRIVRDKNTGVGKGFAFVNFKCTTAVPLALQLDGETLEKRNLRIKLVKYQKKNSKSLIKRPPPQYHSKKFFNPKNKEKLKKAHTFQGEFSQKSVKKQPKKKSAEEWKREKFSQILSNKKMYKKH